MGGWLERCGRDYDFGAWTKESFLQTEHDAQPEARLLFRSAAAAYAWYRKILRNKLGMRRCVLLRLRSLDTLCLRCYSLGYVFARTIRSFCKKTHAAPCFTSQP